MHDIICDGDYYRYMGLSMACSRREKGQGGQGSSKHFTRLAGPRAGGQSGIGLSGFGSAHEIVRMTGQNRLGKYIMLGTQNP